MRALPALKVARASVLKRPACVLSYLKNNQLSGTIPSSLGSLTGVVYLCVRSVVRLAINLQRAASRKY